MKHVPYFFCILLNLLPIRVFSAHHIVLLTDFGTKDGAVSALKGVIYSIDNNIAISDLTHEITPFNIKEASYRLFQAVPFWPKGTIFVNVIDPGVGTERRSIVAKSISGHYFVGPDNGTLTWVEEHLGLKEAREIDLTRHRLPNSLQSNTFFGRDVYAYTAAKLASGKISFSDVGKVITSPLVNLSNSYAKIENNQLKGTIVALDIQYGNVWTNIGSELLEQFFIEGQYSYKVKIYENEKIVFDKVITFQDTFGRVNKGENLLYINSLLNLAIASNQENFSDKYHIGAGEEWTITIESDK